MDDCRFNPYWHEWREVWTTTGNEFRCVKCDAPMPVTFTSTDTSQRNPPQPNEGEANG